jgi:hypothetical protein
MEKIFTFNFLPPPKFVQSEIKVMLHCSVVVTPHLFLDFSLNISLLSVSSLYFECKNGYTLYTDEKWERSCEYLKLSSNIHANSL